MEKYRLVQEHKAPEVSDMFQHEDSTAPGAGPGAATAAAATGDSGFPVVRITQQGKPRNYISYAMGLFVSFSRMVKGAFATTQCFDRARIVSFWGNGSVSGLLTLPFLLSLPPARPKGPPPSSSRRWDGPSTRR